MADANSPRLASSSRSIGNAHWSVGDSRAYTVSLMAHEIGIRMALGAQPGNVLAMVLRKCLRIVGIGIATGLVVALLLVPALRSQLWGVSAIEGLTFALVVALLAGAGALAAYLPARAAVRIDPNTALRAE